MKMMQSIRFRLMSLIAALVVGTLLVVSGVGYYFSDKFLEESLNQTQAVVGSSTAAHVQTEMESSLLRLEDVAMMAEVQSGDKTRMVPVLKTALQRIGKFDDIIFASLDGGTINGEQFTTNIAEREYFQKVVSTKQPYISTMFLSKVNQKYGVALCVPVIRDNQLVGVLFGTYSLEQLVPIIKDIRFKQQGYGALIDASGTYLAHPTRPELMGNMNIKTGEISGELKNKLGSNAKLDPKFVSAFGDSAAKGNPVYVEYKATTGFEQVAYFSPVKLPGGQHWMLLLATTKADAAREITLLSRMILGLSVISLLLVLSLTFLYSKSFVKPIVRINEIAHDIAEGKLKSIQKTIYDKSEFGQLSDSIINMNQNLRVLVQQVQAEATQLAASSEELTASAHQSADASNQVAGSISEIARGTEVQAASANQIMTVAQTMSEKVNHISRAVQEVADTAIATSEAAEQGNQVVEQTVKQMNEIGNHTADTQTTIDELSSSSRDIREMVTLISSIAGQTNLLALNAAIEAARAGEQGRGFAVVAEEVRKLAEESNLAARKIDALVEKNQANLDRVVAKTQAEASGIQTGIALAHNTGETFQKIVAAILHLSEEIKNISASIQQIAAGNQTLVRSIAEIDASSKQAAAETQNVSAATEEQSASMQEIASSSQSLAVLAGELQAAVERFEL